MRPSFLSTLVVDFARGWFDDFLCHVCDHLCLVRIVEYVQHATTSTDHDVHPALPERRAPTVADAAPALARGPRPLPSPEAIGGGARSRPLTLCGSLRSDLARRCWRHRRRGPPGLLGTLPGQIGRSLRLRGRMSTGSDGGDTRRPASGPAFGGAARSWFVLVQPCRRRRLRGVRPSWHRPPAPRPPRALVDVVTTTWPGDAPPGEAALRDAARSG